MKNEVDIVREIQQYLEEHHDEMIAFLTKLVRLESPSGEITLQHEILNVLKEELNELDFYTLHILGKETGGYLYARPIKREKRIPIQLIIGHCDTVWPIDTIVEMPIEDKAQKLKGPGIYDMKVGITQMIFALKAIKDLSYPTKVLPVLLINSDEEIGSKESTIAIKRLAKIANRAFVLEPPLGLDGKLKTARKGIGRFIIKVKGKASHAGLDPKKGISAIVEMSHQIQKLYAMNDFEKGITVNVGMIEGGISPNVIAPESRAVVDVRVLNEVDGDLISSKIKQLRPHLANVTLEIEGGIGRPPMEKNSRNTDLWNIAKQKGALLGISLEQATAGGGSDANTTSQLTATLDGLGTPGDGAHASHEYILKNKMVERTALLTLLLLEEPLIN
ncbi:M20 family metallopeptidase [Spongiivirga citrea]|uniref:M20/M25/M40 family metallo-hydrolase n=1 Tax=Spongiivirga citrea TaxID=1481457 RepID=A0A6M0CJY0_9FLAO|nr:M20 family metallopeptidase [Spongiivirga citrea]NER15737.1 M20/M25/M40 family metallo-hydrolase [Spongiivirga citrea]